MKKYRTNSWENKIYEVDIIRETEKFVVVKYSNDRERREAKQSDFNIYHPTWKNAYIYLLERAKSKLSNAQSNLRIAEENLSDIEKMSNGEVEKE